MIVEHEFQTHKEGNCISIMNCKKQLLRYCFHMGVFCHLGNIARNSWFASSRFWNRSSACFVAVVAYILASLIWEYFGQICMHQVANARCWEQKFEFATSNSSWEQLASSDAIDVLDVAGDHPTHSSCQKQQKLWHLAPRLFATDFFPAIRPRCLGFSLPMVCKPGFSMHGWQQCNLV